MKCVVMTFWQYVRIGLKDFFRGLGPSKSQKWTTKTIELLITFLVSLLVADFVLWLIELLNIFERFATAMIWFLAIAVVIDLIALTVFLVISWRKAVRDCWDKF